MKIQFESGGLFFLIFLVLLVLKLCSVISISWWIATLPLWGSAALALFVILCAFVVFVYSEWRKP